MFQDVQPDGSVVLRKFSKLMMPLPTKADVDYIICTVLDTETTGVEEGDRVVEIALQPVLLDPVTFEVSGYLDSYNQLQDPGRPIPPDVSAINGIYDEDVQGKSIDWAYVQEMLSLSDFVVAHNAKFDAPMVDNELIRAKQRIPPTPWSCSIQMLEWDAPTAQQEVLCWQHNFWYEAHRALNDVHALIHLLTRANRFKELYEASRRPSCVLRAIKSPYQTKDWLKNQKFRWDGQVWSRAYNDMSEAHAMRERLGVEVYGPNRRNEAIVELVSPQQRFHNVVIREEV